MVVLGGWGFLMSEVETPEDLPKAMKKEHTTGGVSQDKFTVSGTMCV